MRTSTSSTFRAASAAPYQSRTSSPRRRGTGGAGGRHELGQNFLVDRRVIADVVELAAAMPHPIVEFGPGSGALTRPLARLGRPLTAIELDGERVERLRREFGRSVEIVHGDVLQRRPPRHPHVVVGNLPFHLTTAILRRLLGESEWSAAVLITQWEVARRRCGVGGASMLTVQWAPWYRFELRRRVPASAFRPRPSVDAGLFTIERRAEPLVDLRERRDYQRFVAEVFQGRGAGLVQRLGRSSAGLDRGRIKRWLRDADLPADTPPGRVGAEQWAELWRLAR